MNYSPLLLYFNLYNSIKLSCRILIINTLEIVRKLLKIKLYYSTFTNNLCK